MGFLQKVFTISILLSLVMPLDVASGEVIEGRIKDVNHIRNTFEVSVPGVKDAAVRDIFIVQQDTEMNGIRNLWDLKVGDRVNVEGEKLNPVVWKTLSVSKM